MIDEATKGAEFSCVTSGSQTRSVDAACILTLQRHVSFCVLAGPPLQLCQDAAYYYGALAADLIGSIWTVLGSGARLLFLPVSHTLGVVWMVLSQLLLPLWQVTRRLADVLISCTPQP